MYIWGRKKRRGVEGGGGKRRRRGREKMKGKGKGRRREAEVSKQQAGRGRRRCVVVKGCTHTHTHTQFDSQSHEAKERDGQARSDQIRSVPPSFGRSGLFHPSNLGWREGKSKRKRRGNRRSRRGKEQIVGESESHEPSINKLS
ncbi:uncharacterized protein BO72DRAFT_264257 [Aspergillus fijiensis CBS 313.89]|uniref:Uncharacterized protein n=1 Tax=Aspergillus fijiensis CBS 313.89 TaxID=1448319 RepID=A0A8G1W2X0_9EURO|nr:uncharacterized protein BO72DRAFT_264257 [Aspergillus fijiensis CBS 313.89]RAK80926.1 hypothetical protein BO72DRAFT_264257 [Aspergillus fijiensis CBS 313.89]